MFIYCFTGSLSIIRHILGYNSYKCTGGIFISWNLAKTCVIFVFPRYTDSAFCVYCKLTTSELLGRETLKKAPGKLRTETK